MDYIAHFKKEITLILLSAGDSTRFSQKGLPKKQWLRIGSKPLWKHLVDFFRGLGFEQIVVTASKEEVFYAKNFYENVIEGGETRTQSILHALQNVQTKYVLIHDVARFNPQKEIIDALLEMAYKHQEYSCIAPKIPISDTIYHINGSYPSREAYYAIQTPQLSKTSLLKSALECGEFSDESSAMSAYGERVAFVWGSTLLHKLTIPDDLFLLKSVAIPPSDEVFVGGGVDIHGFEEGKKMVLCGVEIANPTGFKAHSDGDVGLHSIIDALLGAIGAGDIGEWFPDTDCGFANIDSKILLQKINDFVKGVGYEIVNLDLTIMAQAPKISPYKDQMKETLARFLEILPRQVNIKATTGENLGFIGRKEGVCVLSNVSLRFKRWNQ